MILKFSNEFFIQWDVVFELDSLSLGIFNFWIHDVAVPAKGINLTLNSLFHSLSSNIESMNQLNGSIGDVPIDQIDFSNLENENLIWLDTGELFQFGLGMVYGVNSTLERIFYSIDFEKSYREVILPKGTLMQIFEYLHHYKFEQKNVCV